MNKETRTEVLTVLTLTEREMLTLESIFKLALEGFRAGPASKRLIEAITGEDIDQ